MKQVCAALQGRIAVLSDQVDEAKHSSEEGVEVYLRLRELLREFQTDVDNVLDLVQEKIGEGIEFMPPEPSGHQHLGSISMLVASLAKNEGEPARFEMMDDLPEWFRSLKRVLAGMNRSLRKEEPITVNSGDRFVIRASDPISEEELKAVAHVVSQRSCHRAALHITSPGVRDLGSIEP